MFESTVKTLITSNEEMNDIMTIVKSLEESGLFIQLKMKQSSVYGGLLSIWLGILGATLLENLLEAKAKLKPVKHNYNSSFI